MAVNLVRSTRLFPGAPYAYAARASRGVLIFTAGACPLDEQGQVVAPGDVSAQMRQALQNLRIALEESGATIPDVVKTTVYVASSDRSDLVTAWDEVAGFFGDHDVPSTLLGVAVLGYPGQLVEIEAIAVAPSHLAPREPGRTPTVSVHGLTFYTERRFSTHRSGLGDMEASEHFGQFCARGD
jgi:enamine deaminase RidA (YjgF/YER057c/UK114 family)